MAGRKKLQDETVASQKKTINNPNEEGGCTIPFHSLATTAGRGEDNSISSPPTPEQTPRSSTAESKNDRARRDHPLQIRRSERIPGQQLAGAATSGLAEMGIELQHPYSDATPPPPSGRRLQHP